MEISLELILGIVGTLTGSLSLILQWRQWCIDQPVLKMDGAIKIRRCIEIPDDHLSLRISLKNHGRRHIKVQDIGFLIAENEWQKHGNSNNFLREGRLNPGDLQPRQFVLDEGDRQDLEIYPFALEYIQHARKKEKRVLIFYAIDTLDKEYRLDINLPSEETLCRIESLTRSKKESANE